MNFHRPYCQDARNGKGHCQVQSALCPNRTTEQYNNRTT